jgi:hypothetical protein
VGNGVEDMSSSTGPAPGSTIQIGPTVYTVISSSPVGSEVYATANGENYTLVPSGASASGYSVQRDEEDMEGSFGAAAAGGGNSSSSSAAAPPSAAERFAAIQAAQITRNTAILEAVRQGILPDATPADVATGPKSYAGLSWVESAHSKLSALWGAAKTKLGYMFSKASPVNVAHRGAFTKAAYGSTISYKPSETDIFLISNAATEENPRGIFSASAGEAATESKNAGFARVRSLNLLLTALIILENAGKDHAEAHKAEASSRSESKVRDATTVLSVAEQQYLSALFNYLIDLNKAEKAKTKARREVNAIPFELKKQNPGKYASTFTRSDSVNITRGVAGSKEVVSTSSFFRMIKSTANDCDDTGDSAAIISLFRKYCGEFPFSSIDGMPIIVDTDNAKKELNTALGRYQGRFTEGEKSSYKTLFANVERNTRAVRRAGELPAELPSATLDDLSGLSALAAAAAAEAEADRASAARNAASSSAAGGAGSREGRWGSEGERGAGWGGAGSREEERRWGGAGSREEEERRQGGAGGGSGSRRGGARRTRSKNRKSQKKVRKVKARKTRVHKKRTTRRR